MEPKLLQPMTRPQILAAAATGVERAIAAAGIDAHRVFDLAGIDSARIADPSLRLELGDYCRLFDIAARQSGDDLFGARFGCGFTPPHFSAVGGLVANAPTLKEGLAALARHYGWIQGNSIVGFSIQDGVAMLDYRICDARIPCKQQDAELTLAAFCGLIRAFLGPGWRPLEAHFEHGRGGRLRDYEEIFGETLFFDQPTNRLVIETALVERPIPSPDPRAFAGSRAVIRRSLECVDLLQRGSRGRARPGLRHHREPVQVRRCRHRHGRPAARAVGRRAAPPAKAL
jgi:hypothetical protein